VLDAVLAPEFSLLRVIQLPEDVISQLGLVVGPAQQYEYVVADGGVIAFVIQDNQKSLLVFGNGNPGQLGDEIRRRALP